MHCICAVALCFFVYVHVQLHCLCAVALLLHYTLNRLKLKAVNMEAAAQSVVLQPHATS